MLYKIGSMYFRSIYNRSGRIRRKVREYFNQMIENFSGGGRSKDAIIRFDFIFEREL